MGFTGLNYYLVLKCILWLIIINNAVKVETFLVLSNIKNEDTEDLTLEKFPAEFMFGAASSAYQIEGGWNDTDKSESIWDHFVHEDSSRTNGSTGDVSCDSYHLWEQDVEIAKELGLQFYRFSISWTRLIPDQDTFKVSDEGYAYYNNLINALVKNGNEPMVTLYHWDLPQSLQDIGGWLNPSVTDYFAKYARMSYKLFGNRVKTWITLSEPITFCLGGYSLGTFAPGVQETNGEFICAKNALIAHAKAYKIYDEEFRSKYGGQVSLANNNIWYQAKEEDENNNAKSKSTVNLARQRMTGLYAHPIFSSKGGWPKEMEEIFKDRLPAFTASEIKLVQGSYDFYGLNYYTSRTVRSALSSEDIFDAPITGSTDFGLVYEIDPSWNITYEGNYIALYPAGLRKQINWIKDQYGNIGIMITEHGSPTQRGLNDEDRIHDIKTHLKEVQRAISQDNIKVLGFSFWSLIDSMEWQSGYGPKFGLVDVDFNDSGHTRTLKDSGYFYKELIQNHTSNMSTRTSLKSLLRNLFNI